jgi:hypothetical protein
MIHIISYSGVNGVVFGASEAEFIASFGEPLRRRINSDGEYELHYDDYIARFEAGTGNFREFTIVPECLAKINDIAVQWRPEFLSMVCQSDWELVEALGFVLSLKFGVAFSGFHANETSEMAIHAFRMGDWDSLQALMKPYSP